MRRASRAAHHRGSPLADPAAMEPAGVPARASATRLTHDRVAPLVPTVAGEAAVPARREGPAMEQVAHGRHHPSHAVRRRVPRADCRAAPIGRASRQSLRTAVHPAHQWPTRGGGQPHQPPVPERPLPSLQTASARAMPLRSFRPAEIAVGNGYALLRRGTTRAVWIPRAVLVAGPPSGATPRTRLAGDQQPQPRVRPARSHSLAARHCLHRHLLLSQRGQAPARGSSRASAWQAVVARRGSSMRAGSVAHAGLPAALSPR